MCVSLNNILTAPFFWGIWLRQLPKDYFTRYSWIEQHVAFRKAANGVAVLPDFYIFIEPRIVVTSDERRRHCRASKIRDIISASWNRRSSSDPRYGTFPSLSLPQFAYFYDVILNPYVFNARKIGENEKWVIKIFD